MRPSNSNSRFKTTAGLSSLLKALLPVLSYLLFFAAPAYTQIVNNDNVQRIVHKLASELADKYPFPAISEKYHSTLLKNLSEGKYNNLSESALAGKLTADLAKVHRDVHLNVFANADLFKNLTVPSNSEDAPNAEAESLRRGNYGVKGVELDALTSTAYINFPGPFLASQEAFETAAAAMNLAAYSKHVIIDIRSNGGGSGEMGRFLASYFYDAGNEQFYLNGFYKDRTRDVQEWTYSYVPGKRNPGAKVYILVGRGTGSAAEGFAYAMQQLKRATIIGDTTAGAGIAGTYVPLENNLVVFLPFKMVVGPYSDKGWEGTGVIPDALTGQTDALAAASQVILKDILNGSTSPAEREAVEWLMDENNSTNTPTADLNGRYAGLAGKYNNHLTITYAANGFTWTRTEPGKPVQHYILKELKPDVFTIVDLNKDHGPNSSRVYIVRNGSGKIESLTRKTLLRNGTIYTTAKAFQPL